MLHDDDEDEGSESEEEHPEDEVVEKKVKKEPKDKKGDADKNEEEEDEDESPNNGRNAPVEIDPMVHLVENIIADKKDPGQMRQYLIKYKGLSYHQCKWIPEDDFVNVLSF
jgi:Chromo (CHRromatin Organisation MOdifier) domain